MPSLLINNSERLTCYGLMFLLILYHSQGILPIDSMGPSILIAIWAISLVYLLKILFSKNKLPGFQKSWLLFMLLIIVYFIFYNNYDYEYDYAIVQKTVLNFLPFFPFYYFSIRGVLTRNVLLFFLIIMLPILILNYNLSVNELRYERGREDVVDNSIYMFIGLLPFTFLFKKRLLTFLALVVIWFFIIQSAKRAAIISGIIAFVIFILQSLYESKSKYKITTIVSFIAFLIGSIYIGKYFYLQNEFAMERMELMSRVSNEGEARNFLIEITLNGWLNTDSLFQYIFGVGHNSTRYLTNDFHVSHNDWVEVLSGYGIFGLLVFTSIFYFLMRKVFSKEISENKRIILILFICLALLVSGTSRWFWSSFPYMNCLLLPYILATYNEDIY